MIFVCFVVFTFLFVAFFGGKDRFANAQIAAQAVNLPRPCLSSQFFSQGFGCLRVVCFHSFVHRIILNK